MRGTYRLPETFQTDRFDVRRVRLSDAEAIYEAYAANPQVTRYLGWRPHTSVGETRSFITRVETEWDRGDGFPSVIFPHRRPHELIGMMHARVLEPIRIGYFRHPNVAPEPRDRILYAKVR